MDDQQQQDKTARLAELKKLEQEERTTLIAQGASEIDAILKRLGLEFDPLVQSVATGVVTRIEDVLNPAWRLVLNLKIKNEQR